MENDVEPALAVHYRTDPERDRLWTWATLERLRTEELLERFLPAPPAVVHDVGGARGAYALPLAVKGHAVHLLDAWPPHVEEAASASAAQPEAPLVSCQVGDARAVPYDDASADAVLLLGPLYHLLERADRDRALSEAWRVLRPGGVLFAAAVSRYAATYDGVADGSMAEPPFEAMVESELRDGVHRNPDPEGRPEWFTLTYFHRPEELRTEIADAGFAATRVLAVEGVGAFGVADRERLADPTYRAAVLRAIRRVEEVPELLGATAHLMGVARRP